MMREEAKVFLDNLKICINEHPIVADWLVEIADRKTEPQTKPRCEINEGDCDGCGFCEQEPKDEPQTERHLPDYSYEAYLGRRIMEQMKGSE